MPQLLNPCIPGPSQNHVWGEKPSSLGLGESTVQVPTFILMPSGTRGSSGVEAWRDPVGVRAGPPVIGFLGPRIRPTPISSAEYPAY